MFSQKVLQLDNELEHVIFIMEKKCVLTHDVKRGEEPKRLFKISLSFLGKVIDDGSLVRLKWGEFNIFHECIIF